MRQEVRTEWQVQKKTKADFYGHDLSFFRN